MIYGFDLDGIMAILGRAVVANNRMLLDLQISQQQVEQLKQELEAAKTELEQLKAQENG